jgi:soluble lytic murein transglycosylase-like protein
MGDAQVNINPSTIMQLLQLQLLNRMDLIASGPNGDNDSSDAGLDFAGLLQSLLGEQAAAGLAGPTASRYQPAAAASAFKPAVLRGRLGAASDPAVGNPSSYEPLIEQASAAYGVEPSLIKAVIHQESSYNPYAVSAAGAKGLMQLMDDTGRGLGVTDPFDPQQNVHAGTQFLAGLLRKYKGNEGVALAAYNAGPGRVDQLGIRTDADLAAKLHLLPEETQQYVQRVLALKDRYGAANKG